MINKMEFLNDHWVWPVMLASISLFLVFLWKDWRQAGRRRLVLKLILAVTAVVSLVLLALKPAFPGQKSRDSIILITAGYSSEQLDSLKQENKRIRIVEYNPDNSIPEEVNTAENIYLLGYGVKEYDLWQLKDYPVNFLDSKLPTGIIKLKYGREKNVGDSLELRGIYSQAAKGTKLVLQGPGGADLDSVSLKTEDEQDFELAASLNVAGKYLFRLAEKDSLGEVLRYDPVPVKVTEQENLKILVVNSFPTFETKYLKNFLAEAGHQLAVKTQITRGKFKFEYFNTDRVPADNFSEAALKQFDLLIIDAVSLKNLSGAESQVLEKAVRSQGLGLFIQAGPAFLESGGEPADFAFSNLQGNDAALPVFPEVKISRAPYRFEKEFALEPVHESGESILSAYKRTGQGRIGTTVFTNTWELILDGKNNVYRQLWTDLVENISKRKTKATIWAAESVPAYKNEPFHFRLKTSAVEPSVFSETGTLIPLMQDVYFPSLWQGKTWPRKEGWNSLTLKDLDTLDYYVYDHSNWQSLSAAKTIEANRRFFEQGVKSGKSKKPLHPVEPLWFFGLFIICIGGLWLEPKL